MFIIRWENLSDTDKYKSPKTKIVPHYNPKYNTIPWTWTEYNPIQPFLNIKLDFFGFRYFFGEGIWAKLRKSFLTLMIKSFHRKQFQESYLKAAV